MTTTQTYAALDRLIAYRPVIIATSNGYDIQSSRDPGHFHRVTRNGCTCEAGQHGRRCMHWISMAAIERGVLDVGTWTYTRPGATRPPALETLESADPRRPTESGMETPISPPATLETARNIDRRKVALVASRLAA